MTTSTPTRAKKTYPIPSTNLTLHLTLGLNLPLPTASIRSCLQGAIAVARSHSPQCLTPATVFRFQQPEGEKDRDARFGIVGDAVFGTNELSWGDVVGVLRGLGGRMEGEGGGGVEVWFRVVEGGEEGRGQMGDGYLRKGGGGGGGGFWVGDGWGERWMD